MEYPSYISAETKAWLDGHNFKEPKRNWYICDTCHHTTATVENVPGVTPMFHDCEKCTRRATSSMYRLPYPEAEMIEPTEEWYRPDDAEFNSMKQEWKHHYRQGGLKTRKITAASKKEI